MRTYTPIPFAASPFGAFSLVERALQDVHAVETPAHDIVQVGADDFRVRVALPGVQEDDLAVVEHEGALKISGTRADALAADDADSTVKVFKRGIAAGKVELSFRLGDHVKVVGAELDAGILTVSLAREVPEALQPKHIAIGKAA